jgi:hypothetical protein
LTPPPGTLGYSRVDDVIIVSMTLHDWSALMLFLGVAAGSERVDCRDAALALANRLNQGRPVEEWRPYAIPEKP